MAAAIRSPQLQKLAHLSRLFLLFLNLDHGMYRLFLQALWRVFLLRRKNLSSEEHRSLLNVKSHGGQTYFLLSKADE